MRSPLLTGLALAALAPAAVAQMAMPAFTIEPYDLDSGYLHNPQPVEQKLFDLYVRMTRQTQEDQIQLDRTSGVTPNPVQ